ncbi:MAG: hypothetical protein PHW76_09710 [Alphaproteobacteria bacterium]|nr:hypothetical protein [Alphaproteobacteria bacterium]
MTNNKKASVTMRILPALAALAFSLPAFASEQIPIDSGKVLRGAFEEQKQVKGLNDPLHFTGKFIVAPDKGLIWKVEKPLATSTVITKTAAVQNLGGIAMPLKIRRLAQIYEIVGQALTGDWHSLQPDFSISRSNQGDHWIIVLKPRPGSTAKLPYATITVKGSSYVENITLAKADGVEDAFAFTNAELSQEPLTAQENALFASATR